MDGPSTAIMILDAAERTTRSVGYNGLSFRDLAAAVGIKSASVHYHFPSKAHLGAAIARRYTDRLVDHLKSIDIGRNDLESALAAYVDMCRQGLGQDGKMCLCGMLAAETDAIPPAVQAEVRRFVDLNVQWLSSVLQAAKGTKVPPGEIKDHAMAIFAAVEGAILIARGTGDIASFDAMAKQFARSGLLR